MSIHSPERYVSDPSVSLAGEIVTPGGKVLWLDPGGEDSEPSYKPVTIDMSGGFGYSPEELRHYAAGSGDSVVFTPPGGHMITPCLPEDSDCPV